MGLYTRQQLLLLLLLLGAAGVGLGVVHWRSTHPALVEQLEQLDREILATEVAKPDERPAARAEAPRPPRDQREASSTPSPPRSKLRTPPPADTSPPLDLNRATAADLARLPGVGPVLARRILETRDAVGRFASVDDLTSVRGVGPSKLERLRPFVGVLE